MKCEELLKALNDYVDGAALTEVCEEFAEQLDGCSPCQVVVDNVRHTISLFQSGESYPLPEQLQQRLNDVLHARWQEKFDGPGKGAEEQPD